VARGDPDSVVEWCLNYLDRRELDELLTVGESLRTTGFVREGDCEADEFLSYLL
jgi:hypothetical protein